MEVLIIIIASYYCIAAKITYNQMFRMPQTFSGHAY